MRTLYTIGHSTRAADLLTDLLRAHRIGTLVDVRTVPHSRHNPQFNRQALAASGRGAATQQIHRPVGHGLDRLGHGGQRRLGDLRLQAVVEADDGEIAGHRPSGRRRRLDGADGHGIVGAEDGGQIGPRRQEPPRRRHAAFDPEFSIGDGIGRQGRPEALQLVGETLHPLIDAFGEAGMIADAADPAMAKLVKMRRSQRRARRLKRHMKGPRLIDIGSNVGCMVEAARRLGLDAPSAARVLSDSGVEPGIRAERLGLPEFARIAEALRREGVLR